VLTQDWHPPGHLSFASNHPGRKPYETIQVAYSAQILWPDHCVQGTLGAEFRKDLQIVHAELILRKGYHREIDSYSTFFENDRKTRTGLAGYLRERGFTRVFLAGLALDFCVRYSAEDARREGFDVVVVDCRGIDIDGSMLATRQTFRRQISALLAMRSVDGFESVKSESLTNFLPMSQVNEGTLAE
jgi:nicotinamidase/pyrazinamidase